MSTLEIRKRIHHLIYITDNENIPLFFYDMMKRRSSLKDGQVWNQLSVEQKEELLLSITESENTDTLICHKEMNIKHKKWLYLVT